MGICKFCIRALEGCPDEDNERMVCDEMIYRKSVMLSIEPHWAHLIETGEKTIEVRKSKPCPKHNQHEPFRVYLYVTKHKESLLHVMYDGEDFCGEPYHGKPVFLKTFKHFDWQRYTQVVAGECVCDGFSSPMMDIFIGEYEPPEGCCLTAEQMKKYAGGKRLYGWHLRDVVIYKKPKSLAEFGLKRPPQSWCYVKDGDTE